MVRLLASHQCCPGSNLGPGVICVLSLLFVVGSHPCSEGLSPGTSLPLPPPPRPPPHTQKILNSNFIWKQWKRRATLWISTEIPYIYCNARTPVRIGSIYRERKRTKETRDVFHTFASDAVKIQRESWFTQANPSIVRPGANITASSIVYGARINDGYMMKSREKQRNNMS